MAVVQFSAVEVGDCGENLPDAPETEEGWLLQAKAKLGSTAAGDTKISIEWKVLEDYSGEHPETVNKTLFTNVVIRPVGHQWEKMFRQDIAMYARGFGLTPPKGWDAIVAFVKEIDGQSVRGYTKTDKKGNTRVILKAAQVDEVEAEEEKEEAPTPKAKKKVGKR